MKRKLNLLVATLVALAFSLATPATALAQSETNEHDNVLTDSAWKTSGNVTYTISNQEAVFNYGNEPPNGQLEQTFSTTPGRTYTLEFSYRVSGMTRPHTLQVQLDGIAGKGSILDTAVVADSPSYNSFEKEFVADSSTTTLRFSDDPGNNTIASDSRIANVVVLKPKSLVVNLDASENNQDNPVVLTLAPGTYRVHVLGPDESGEFQAWNSANFKVGGCDRSGKNCRYGWDTRYYFQSPSYHKAVDDSCDRLVYGSCRYALPSKAAARPPEDEEFTLSEETEVKFYLYNSNPDNNQGGLSLTVTRQ